MLPLVLHQALCLGGLFAGPGALTRGTGPPVRPCGCRCALGAGRLVQSISAPSHCLTVACGYLPDGSTYAHLEPQFWGLLARGHLEMMARETYLCSPVALYRLTCFKVAA